MDNYYLLEDYIFFLEDICILEESVFDRIADLKKLSVNDIKDKLIEKKNKAKKILQKKGIDNKTIDKISHTVANKIKDKVHIDKFSDINKKNSIKLYNIISNEIKKELKKHPEIVKRFGEGKFILSTIALFFITVIGTLALITSIKGILLIPFYLFLMHTLYENTVSKYLKDYYE